MQGRALLLVGPIGAAELRDLESRRRQVALYSPAAGTASVGGCSAPFTCVVPFSPSGRRSMAGTSLTVFPRHAATSSGRLSDCRPETVAFTRLIGFCVPRLFESTSRM